MDVVRARLGTVLLLSLSLLTACANSTQTAEDTLQKPTAECSETAVPNRFLVRYKTGETKVYEADSREAMLRDVIEPNLAQIEFAEQDQLVQIKQDSVVHEAKTVPDTIDWGQVMIEASDAWTRGYKGEGVIVAVLDSGVDLTHVQLKNQLAVNDGEAGTDASGHDKATNKVDDDGNGLIDDVSGYDFFAKSGLVRDGNGHGTHVSGIIAGQHSAGPVKGVAPSAKILPLDFMDDGSGKMSDAVEAMYYAVSRGAKIVNASWGGQDCSKSLQKAVMDLGKANVLFVAAAGNDGDDIDYYPTYPAAFGLSNQITVGSSTIRDNRDDFSNYSNTLVQLMAPGSDIYSTYPVGKYRHLSGTSMASPFVAGAAAVLWGARPNATATQIRKAIMSSVDAGPFKVESSGRLNVRKALDEILKL